MKKTWSVAKHSFPKFNLYNQKTPHSNARKPIKLKWFPQCLDTQHSVSSFISANISVLIEEIYFRVIVHPEILNLFELLCYSIWIVVLLFELLCYSNHLMVWIAQQHYYSWIMITNGHSLEGLQPTLYISVTWFDSSENKKLYL